MDEAVPRRVLRADVQTEGVGLRSAFEEQAGVCGEARCPFFEAIRCEGAVPAGRVGKGRSRVRSRFARCLRVRLAHCRDVGIAVAETALVDRASGILADGDVASARAGVGDEIPKSFDKGISI